ncbi:MAG TPA: alpha/beta hydrolase-fold protein [Solirubrobacteraceae bacterium]|jgi:enterochelin esterase-like enzyme
MSTASRAQLWLESLGDWSWPGQGGGQGDPAREASPPSWVPAFPPRLESFAAAGAGAVPGAWQSPRAIQRRRVGLGALLSAVAAVCAMLVLHGPLSLEHLVGVHTAPAIEATTVGANAAPAPPPVTLEPVSEDAAGSSIDEANFPSAAVHGEGSFFVYLPAGYASTASHYPVLYMLTGDDQSNTAFLQVGLQSELDRLIAQHMIPPMIAVLIQGGPGSNNWRNEGATRYESYILETQQLVDRTLPTLAERGARAIVGDSMGGYGAMNVALANPYRFGVVESWLSFFNGLGGDLHADRPIIKQLGLHAFVYGGEEDHIANPDEDVPFAAALRAAGADARGAVYPGEHNLATVEAHLASMLTFAGRSLSLRP